MPENKSNLHVRLERAIEQCLPRSVEKLIKSGADVSSEKVRDNLLGVAVESGNLEIVKILLSAGADPNKLPSEVTTPPLVLAANRSDNATIKELLEHNANPNINHGEALLKCAQNFNLTGVSLLIKYGVNPNSSGLFRSSSALHEVAAGNISSLKEMWRIPEWSKRAVEIDNALFHGEIPKSKKKATSDRLISEYRNCGVEIAKALIDSGAIIQNLEHEGSPIASAAKCGYMQMRAFLEGVSNLKIPPSPQESKDSFDSTKPESAMFLADIFDIAPSNDDAYFAGEIYRYNDDDNLEEIASCKITFINSHSIREIIELENSNTEHSKYICGYLYSAADEDIPIYEEDQIFVSISKNLVLHFEIVECAESGTGHGLILIAHGFDAELQPNG